MTLQLIDFREGYCPATDPKLPNYHWSITLQRQVRIWIDAGLIEEDLAESASVLGLLRLTDKGREECGLAKPVPPVVETQGELF